MLVLNVGNVVGTNLRGKSKMLDTTWPQKGGLPPDVTAPPHTYTLLWAAIFVQQAWMFSLV